VFYTLIELTVLTEVPVIFYV